MLKEACVGVGVGADEKENIGRAVRPQILLPASAPIEGGAEVNEDDLAVGVDEKGCEGAGEGIPKEDQPSAACVLLVFHTDVEIAVSSYRFTP